MKRLSAILTLAVPLLFQPLLAQDYGNRIWKSKNGQEIEAMILGVDDDGKVVLQPLKPYKVALESLSEEDQAYVEKWEVEHAQDQELLKKAREDRVYAAPIMRILQQGLYKLEKDELVPYPLEKPEEIKFVVFYMTLQGDPLASKVADTYEKLRRRNPSFEFVAISFDDSPAAMKKHLADSKITMPVMDFGFRDQIRGTALGGMNKVYPQLIAVDINGKVLANSYRSPTDEVNMVGALSDIEKIAREAQRSTGEAEE